MAGGDITVEILKEIRDELRVLRNDTNTQFSGVRSEIRSTNQRVDLVETAMLDVAEQLRFVVRYTKAISERDADLGPRVSALESRVDKLESK